MDASKTCLVIIPRLRLLHVLCDCDIQYFPHKDKWWNELLALLESGVLFMQENTRNEINSGVYIIPHSMRQDMIALLDVISTDPSYYTAPLLQTNPCSTCTEDRFVMRSFRSIL